MLKGPLLLATLGLALNVCLWGIPGMVAASGAVHLISPSTPTIAEALNQIERDASPTPSLPDALVQLISAEATAMQVAGAALQQPTPQDMVPRANAAGAQVLGAVQTYVRAEQAITRR